jgi:hypothetical protein
LGLRSLKLRFGGTYEAQGQRPKTQDRFFRMHRPTVGLIALVLLTGAAACYLLGWGSTAIESAFWRVGLVMALIWLALPDLLGVRNKLLLGAFLAIVLVAAVKPKFFPLALLFCVVYAVLRPRRRPGR